MPVTSTAIPNPNDWADTSLLIPHEVFRRWLLEVKSIKLTSRDRAVKLNAWWIKVFAPCLQHHHDMEEHVYFPWLSKKCTIPAKLTTDHVGLVDLMDKATKALKQAAATGDAADLSAATSAIAVMTKHVEEHLAEEEEKVPALLRSNYTQQEEGKTVQTILKKSGLGFTREFLPGIIDAMHQAGGYGGLTAPDFTKTLPPPVRFLHKYFWAKRYQKKTIGLLRSLQV